jgi:hypothetical protein
MEDKELSRSVQRRIAAQKGEPAPDFSNEPTYDIVDSDGNLVEAAQPSAENTFAEPPKMPTPAEMRKLRKQYVTVQHPKVVACGHSLDLSRQPAHTNCESCWFAWFQNHGEVVQQCDEMFQADGGVLIVQLQGKKFLHRYLQFMSTLAAWEKENAQANSVQG